MNGSEFYFEENGVLAQYVEPGYGSKRRPYVHRCTPAVYEEVCHLVDEADSFTLEELVARGRLPSSQAALALRFLREYGMVEGCHPRHNRRMEESIYLSAMTCWHGLREGGIELPGARDERGDAAPWKGGKATSDSEMRS